MGKTRRAAVLPTNIILLQNVVRRDPESYYEEFIQQYSHYESLRDIFLMNPSGDNSEEFGELVGFVSAVCTCYPKETARFPEELKTILLNNHKELDPDLREKIIQCLTMLRNKGVISAEMLIQTIFPLLHAYGANGAGHTTTGKHVKQLRHQIYSTLIALIKSVNTGTKNQKINRSTQALLFNLLEKQDSQGLWATKLTRELWRRGIWDDSRTVELMTQAALHSDVKVSVAGAKFFLGADKEREETLEDSSDEEGFDMGALKHKMQINKKSSKRGRKFEQAVKTMKKKNSKGNTTYLNFSAIHLLRDPQGFAESIYNTHLSGKNGTRFDLDQKIMFMNLVSRLVGTHKLTVLGIYSFFLKYLTPKQRNVTQIMAAAAQASHELVPPESIHVVIRKIADEFISEGVASEVAAAGINTIREICERAPLAIEPTLLQDLSEYKGSKSKPVVAAAKGLINLYREKAPHMLRKKDRGKVASIEIQKARDNKEDIQLKYGVETSTVTSVPGLELLAKWKEENGGEENDQDWEVASDSEDDVEGEWVTVKSDEEINISDSDDEEKKDDSDSDSDLELSDDEKEEKADETAPAKSADQIMQEVLGSRILTPADFSKLEELKTEAGVAKLMGLKHEDVVDSTKLVGSTKYKQSKEERIAAAKEGKEDREKFGSRRGKRTAPHSTTNREKARKKNFTMMIHKKAVQGKQKLSLRERQKLLRAHIDKQKKKGH